MVTAGPADESARWASGGQRLDVIAELAAHQQNLTAPTVPSAAVLVALPLAPLCSFMAADWFAASRARALAELAETLGGGDGPLSIVELGPAAASLPARLAALWQSGTRALFVHGMEDRPGFARALRYRWPGALHPVERPTALAALHRGGEPVRWLAPGAVRIGPGVPAPEAACVFAAVDDGADPREVRGQGAHVWPFALDPERRLGGWSGALPPRGAFGSGEGERVRARWDAFWTELGRPEVVRLAALGLDPALEAALRGDAPNLPPAVRPRARVIAITGIDGAGKSWHADRLARTLGERGARVRVLKLYRQGAFLELANELGGRTRRGGPLAAFCTSRIVKLVDSLRVYRDQIVPALAECDAMVMDRYVETHVAAARSQLGWDLSRHAALRPFPPADLRFWLELDPAAALRRRNARGERASADEHPVGLTGYAREFAGMAAGPDEVRLDAAADQEANARAIADRVRPLLGELGGGSRDQIRLSAASGAPVSAGHRTRCLVHLGPCAGLPELGADVLDLRVSLEAWCGSAAASIPESFWLEAYAAQLLLDRRTLAPARAQVALWPGALARMAEHAELEMLRELERMLLAEVDVAAYVAEPRACAVAFARLGAEPSAAERLGRTYAVALEELAHESGWPAGPGPVAERDHHG